MKTIAVGFLVVASAARVTATSHHDDTFYEDYLVGGHSHPKDSLIKENSKTSKPNRGQAFDTISVINAEKRLND